MEQFPNRVRDRLNQEPAAPRTGLFGWLGNFFSSRAPSQSVTEGSPSTAEASRRYHEIVAREWEDPSLNSFFSPEGAKTIVSIRRPVVLSEGVSAEVEFVAVHNCGNSHPPINCQWFRDPGVARHTLTSSLKTFCDGRLTLTGCVRELGTSPLVSGPIAPGASLVLLNFELYSNGGSAGRRLTLDAQRIVEIFTDRGVAGLDDYLRDLEAAVGKEECQLFRDDRLDEQSDDTTDV